MLEMNTESRFDRKELISFENDNVPVLVTDDDHDDEKEISRTNTVVALSVLIYDSLIQFFFFSSLTWLIFHKH